MPRIPPNEIDILIGQRIRRRRKDWNITQQTLADALGISYQQIQKYESGKNRIAAAMLIEIAYELSVPVEYFVVNCDYSDKPTKRVSWASQLFR